MSLKYSALLAFIGTLLLTILIAVDFISTASGFIRELVPAVALLRSFIYTLASIGITIFFCVFSRSQSQ